MPKEPPNDPAPPANVLPDETKSWEDDQKARGYYYDDSHGYEVYEPCLADEEPGDEEADIKEKGTPAS